MREIDLFSFIDFFFLAKTGKIQKCGRQVETLKYMHDFNVVVYLENRLIFFFVAPFYCFRHVTNLQANWIFSFAFSLKKRKRK